MYNAAAMAITHEGLQQSSDAIHAVGSACPPTFHELPSLALQRHGWPIREPGLHSIMIVGNAHFGIGLGSRFAGHPNLKPNGYSEGYCDDNANTDRKLEGIDIDEGKQDSAQR